MPKHKHLPVTLRSMHISCDDKEYGIVTLPAIDYVQVDQVLSAMHETEGWAVIATTDYFASRDLAFEGPFAKLDIVVHVPQDFVSLIAVLSERLADSDIAANFVAAYYRDYIFVPYDVRNEAIQVLSS